jgi:DNA-binding response OmpR family regulator
MANILVVEDEIHIQRLIKLVLEKQAHQVDCVGSGEEALEFLLAKPKLDLILLDIMMPGIDGLQVLRKLKANSAQKGIPVVLLTALAQENVVIQGIKLGASDYIRKPFHPTELVKRLSKHLIAG